MVRPVSLDDIERMKHSADIQALVGIVQQTVKMLADVAGRQNPNESDIKELSRVVKDTAKMVSDLSKRPIEFPKPIPVRQPVRLEAEIGRDAVGRATTIIVRPIYVD
jgi:hypothetical protein